MKNEKFKLVLVGLLITLGICALIYTANIFLPEHLKFDAEIWGTVDSWMVYLVTLVTAVFLFKTLESQKDVQNAQNEIKNIEIKRYRSSIAPILEVTNVTDRQIHDALNNPIINVDLVFTKNVAKNLKTKVNSSISDISYFHGGLPVQAEPKRSNTLGDILVVEKYFTGNDVIVLELLVNKQTIGDPLIIGLYFSDLDNHTIYQEVSIYLEDLAESKYQVETLPPTYI